MGETSAIEWTDATWNPWRGCDKVSPGCAHCYMFRDQRRYGRDPSVVVRCAPSTFNAPLRWEEPRMVFTCSWSDFFHEDADQWREAAWQIIQATPHLTYQILTKRPERMLEWVNRHRVLEPNVWLGVSIENRRFVDRADILRETPAAARFISAEPLLGSLTRDAEGDWDDALALNGIDWLIVGGESGGPSRRRLVDSRNVPTERGLEWVRDLRDATRRWASDEVTQLPGPGHTAFFFKQWGGPRPESGGRELDGRTWDEMPETKTAVPA